MAYTPSGGFVDSAGPPEMVIRGGVDFFFVFVLVFVIFFISLQPKSIKYNEDYGNSSITDSR